MIRQKYALQHIDHRNGDSTNIFFNSDRKLLCLNFTYLQLSIPFMVFVTKYLISIRHLLYSECILIQNKYELKAGTIKFGIELPRNGMDILQ